MLNEHVLLILSWGGGGGCVCVLNDHVLEGGGDGGVK